MLTQQDIYATSSENRPHMPNKDNYVPWSSCLLCYANSKPHGKLIYNSIMNGPYVRRMISEPGDPDRDVPIAKNFHKQTDDKLTEKEVGLSLYITNELFIFYRSRSVHGYAVKGGFGKEMKFGNTLCDIYSKCGDMDASMQVFENMDERKVKQIEADDQATQTILMGLSEDIYAVVDSCETTQEIWLHVVQKAVQNLGVHNVRNQNGLIVIPGIANQNMNQNKSGNVVAARAEGDLDKIEEVNANCILMANLQQASTSGTQTDNALVYDSDGSTQVHHCKNCYDNDIFNMFTQEEQYTELLKPIYEPHQVQQNDSNVIFAVSSVEQSGGTVEQNPITVEETRAYFESLYNNLAIEVEKVNSVNRKMKETNADLTTKLARYKNQEKCFEINQEKYDKLERCCQKSVYQEQCLTKKINALHLSSAKTITTLNAEIINLNNQLSKEKSMVSFL
ncbi:hypothetical protein Tco_0001874 [Tanacetum coccineum]